MISLFFQSKLILLEVECIKMRFLELVILLHNAEMNVS